MLLIGTDSTGTKQEVRAFPPLLNKYQGNFSLWSFTFLHPKWTSANLTFKILKPKNHSYKCNGPYSNWGQVREEQVATLLVSGDSYTILVLIAASCAAEGTAGGLWRSFSKMVLNLESLLACSKFYFFWEEEWEKRTDTHLLFSRHGYYFDETFKQMWKDNFSKPQVQNFKWHVSLIRHDSFHLPPKKCGCSLQNTFLKAGTSQGICGKWGCSWADGGSEHCLPWFALTEKPQNSPSCAYFKICLR